PSAGDPESNLLLPADDPAIFGLDVDGLADQWRFAMERAPMSAEAMTGADRRAQRLGMPTARLMEHAGTAVAAVAHAVAVEHGRWGSGPILVLAGPGNNGGDGFVAARRLAQRGAQVVVGFVSSAARPEGQATGPNWDRLGAIANVSRIHAEGARDVAVLAQGIERAAVIVDALLGTGVRGALREPIRSAVDLTRRAREAGVPVVAVDTPTPDGGRPHERRGIRSGRPSRRHRHVPSAQGRPPDEEGRRNGRPSPRRAYRHPGRGRSWLTRGRIELR
ncbi:MAG: NAD(P)H-hydrate epimerase, partial [Chloroflexi bacterium]